MKKQDNIEPPVTGFLLVSKGALTKNARKTMKRAKNYSKVPGGYYQIRIGVADQNRLRNNKITRVGLLNEMGIY